MILLGWLACAPPPPPPDGTLVIVREQEASWTRNFNPFAPTPRWPTASGVYEPLLLHNPLQERWEPWLATGWDWSEDASTLTFTLRDQVLFSDGEPFDSADVLFTLEMLREHPALDTRGLWARLSDAQAPDERTVVVTLVSPYSPLLSDFAALPIVPEHLWRQVEDPVLFTNPDPVATGPFTEVLRFDAQVYELGRNERYWQGPPGVEVLRFPALASNDAANLALITGDADWAGNFVPAVERTFVARDPEHNHYWFPAVGGTIQLLPNNAVAPFDDVRVRKAISMAIDRERLVDIALYGYVEPAHVTGLTEGHASWRQDFPAAQDWTVHDPGYAGKLLDEAGLHYGPGGWRTLPDGRPWQPELTCPSGWSDWVRALQVMARDLQAVGIDARVRTLDFSAWYESVMKGDFDLSMGWADSGPTPYAFYRSMLSPREVKPVGETGRRNWHRFGSPEAEAALLRFEASTDPQVQHEAMDLAQQVFVVQAPSLPLFGDPAWGEARSERFTGWPSPEDPYARLSPNFGGDALLVLTRLQPVDTRQAEAQ